MSHGSWYRLFVNMEYRGVYNVVERIDGDFSRAHLGAETEFDIVHDGVAAEGSLDAWMRLGELVKSQDLASEADYEQAIEWIDLEGFTDYMILNIWAQNHDWPHKNYFAVRPRSDDGKFVFLSWDAEISLGLYPPGFEADTFERALVRGEALSDLFAGLMANRRYQELFIRWPREASLRGARAVRARGAHSPPPRGGRARLGARDTPKVFPRLTSTSGTETWTIFCVSSRRDRTRCDTMSIAPPG